MKLCICFKSYYIWGKKISLKIVLITYVFRGKGEFEIELIVQTLNPNDAIGAIAKEKLQGVVDITEHLITIFSEVERFSLYIIRN
jgi:hypothetical protein